MATARAGTKDEALRLLDTSGITAVELDYETGWQDAVELGRRGQRVGIRVEFRGHESIAVQSLAALVAGLARPKVTFRQRNLYCRFDLGGLPAGELERLEAKAAGLGDYVLAGHLLRNVDAYWDTHVLKRCTSRCGVTACGLGRAYQHSVGPVGRGKPEPRYR